MNILNFKFSFEVKEKREPVNKGSTRKIVTTELHPLSNVVIVDDKRYNIANECKSIKGKKVAYYKYYNYHDESSRIKYVDNEGFRNDNPTLRPFKPGKVKGYVVRGEFYIIGNTD